VKLHNALRRCGGLLTGIKAMVGMTEAEAGVERLGETLVPVFNPWERPEAALVRGEELWAAGLGQGAGAAGMFSKIGIFNPLGTNLLVVVLTHLIRVPASTDVILYPLATALGNTQTVVMRDRRRTLSHGAVIQFEATAAAGADAMFHIKPQAAETTQIQLPIVLAPGTGFMWRSADDAADLHASFAGYQRGILPGELL